MAAPYKQLYLTARWVSRPKGKGSDPKYTLPTFRHGRSVMLWGAISWDRRYPLVKIDLKEGTPNGERWLEEIVEPHLSEQLRSLRRYGQHHVKVVEDGSRIHFKKSIMEEKDRLRITNLFHPPSSPDLNPIENMWAILKGDLRRRTRVPTSDDALWEAIQEEWNAIPISTVISLIGGMERRRAELVSKRGWSIEK